MPCRRVARLLAVAAILVAPAPACAAVPPLLSSERGGVDVGSASGSNAFGRWAADRHGLPSFLYEIDHRTDPSAKQIETKGGTDAWHQLGNDRIVANAFNRGHTQLWSQDRIYQWVNLAEPAARQYGGGYGWLRVGDEVRATRYDDQPAGTELSRRFGTGYYERILPARPVSVRERVYAPWGDDPVLLHDVILRNHTRAPVKATWFEYWGINPVQQLPGRRVHRGLSAPSIADDTVTFSQSDPQDSKPLRIFAASLEGPVEGIHTDGARFFGAGGPAKPAAVVADDAQGSVAGAVLLEQTGTSMVSFRAPVTIPAGKTLRLRYLLGTAHAAEVPKLVAKHRAARSSYAEMAGAWRDWLPRIKLGNGRDWFSREAQWSAYALRSGTTYEEECGHHIISQGGFYQYSFGFQGAYRDPLQHMLPMIWAEPEIAREVLRYSSRVQPQTGFIPYAQLGLCRRFDFGTSNDLGIWLLLAGAEYGLATRDTAFFDERIDYAGAGGADATIWEHMKLAFRTQESMRGLNGGYTMGATGDWSDFSTEFGPMTESLLVVAQNVFIYPRLAELADLRGDRAFAEQLRSTAAGLREVLARNWIDKGWYARAWAATIRHGDGVMYGEPQPWALMAGAPTAEQQRLLVANTKRLLTGIGSAYAPAKIGSAASPARDDPMVTERTFITGIGKNNAVYVGGVWYAINGWLVQGLAEADGTVPGAKEFAFDELLRNTLHAHSTNFPHHWNGTISVDDACRAYHDTEQGRCGVGLSSTYNGWIMHQPAYELWGAIRLAGIEPHAGGLRIDPHLPLSRFRLQIGGVGVAREAGRMRGYVRTERSGDLAVEVVLPAGVRPARVRAGRRSVPFMRDGRSVRFTLPTVAGRFADWSITFR